jgi:hypothetical protein
MKKPPLTASYLAAAICVAAMTAQSPSAQCNYRMNDLGRPHGYLSGPCNGAAQNYAGAYRSRAATEIVGTRTANGAIIRRGNLSDSTIPTAA